MNTPAEKRGVNAPGCWLAWALILAILLLGPVVLSLLADAGGLSAGIESLLAVSGLLLVVLGLSWLKRPLGRVAAFAAALAVAVLCAIHLGEAAMIWFSGRGFGPELYGHAEWGAVRVALGDYLPEVILAALGILISGFAAWGLLRHTGQPRRRPGALMLFCGVGLMTIYLAHLPAVKLLESWQNWRSASDVAALTQSSLDPWVSAGLVNVPPPFKQRIHASLPEQPRNLVLIFLESFSLSMLEHPDWPNLTPTLSRLQDQYGWPEPFYASGYVTIEGIANSLCGTLIPYFQGNDSMTAGAGLAPNLPCLTDVLSRAGYRQTYLGGAESRFAGKGAFLKAHGYDEVLGWEHWKSQGLRQRENSWGLSDVDLLEQATRKLEEFQAADDPFHISLLTIGTHLPGYSYAECRRYPGSDSPFIQAVHCTDQLLGDWLASARTSGLLDDTVVVITADHTLFPNPEMRKLFGEAATRDRRLPLIVINSGDWEEASARPGQSMDLPPTILDVLGIEHDAGFVLGTSLLQPDPPPAYWPARYGDMYGDAQRVDNNYVTCNEGAGSPDEPFRVQIPLDACGKQRLLEVLSGLQGRYAQGSEHINCSSPEPLSIEVAQGSDQVVYRLGNAGPANPFTRMGRAVRADQSGVRALGFDAEGSLIAATFYPATELKRIDTTMAAYPDSTWFLQIDAGLNEISDSEKLTAWLASPDPAGQIIVYRPGEGVLQTVVMSEGEALNYRLEPSACRGWFERGAGSG